MLLIRGRERQKFHTRWTSSTKDACMPYLGISWRDHVINDELMKRAGMEDLLNIVKIRRLTLTGHILWLPLDRLAGVVMPWVPDGGQRRREHLSKTW